MQSKANLLLNSAIDEPRIPGGKLFGPMGYNFFPDLMNFQDSLNDCLSRNLFLALPRVIWRTYFSHDIENILILQIIRYLVRHEICE